MRYSLYSVPINKKRKKRQCVVVLSHITEKGQKIENVLCLCLRTVSPAAPQPTVFVEEKRFQEIFQANDQQFRNKNFPSSDQFAAQTSSFERVIERAKISVSLSLCLKVGKSTSMCGSGLNWEALSGARPRSTTRESCTQLRQCQAFFERG